MRNRLPNTCLSGVLTISFCALIIVSSSMVWGAELSSSAELANPESPETKATRGFPGDDILVVPAAAFKSDGNSPDSRFFPFGGGYFAGTLASYGCMVAPVNLPDGVIIRQFFVSVYDNDATTSFSLNLMRTNNFDGSVDTLGTVQTTISGAFAGIEILNDPSIASSFVVRPDYSYYLTTCLFSSNIRLYSVRFHFEFPMFYDGFESGTTAAWSVTNP